MMKKTIKIILLILTLFLFTACLELIKKNEYVSTNYYENRTISATNEIARNTVAILNDNNVIGSAVIIKEDQHGLDNLYYAVTLTNNLNSNNLTLYVNNVYNNVEIINTYKNNDYNLSIITFKVRAKLKTTKILSKDNEVKDIFVGQTILSVGSDSKLENINNTKLGTISFINNNENIFTHDAATNHGELGSGVYDLDGYLVGINIDKTYYNTTNEGQENILGLNYAVNVKLIGNLLLSIDQLSNGIISNNILDQNIETISYNKTHYESSINNIYVEANDSVVRINHNDLVYSGIIIEKENNDYYVLTTYLDEIANLKVIINNKEYVVDRIENIGENNLISKLVVRTTDNLKVYNKNPFTTKTSEKLVKGQTVVAMGSYNNELTNLLNKGTLAKDNYIENTLFMHDIKLNMGQLGSPIFNLNGNLIGIYTNKISEVRTGENSFMVAEGLGFAYNLNNLDIEINLIDYLAKDEYEEAIINVVNEVSNNTVTVRTNSGHGSGIIFKKDKYKGQNRYYVLTNEHVIENATEISIYFNDDRIPVRAFDFHLPPNRANTQLDMAVVRYVSNENYDVFESKVMNKEETLSFIPGQTVIAIGTPENTDKFNYVTTGIMKNKVSNFDGIANSAVNHDAALNPGNSGGPLFDLKGNLIGINVAKGTRYDTNEGVVFSERLSISLNINNVSDIYNSSFNRFSYTKLPEHAPRLGITVTEINEFKKVYPNLINYLPLVDVGIVVIDVDQLYGAYGKVEIYDVVVEMNGLAITNLDDIRDFLLEAKFGDKHILTIARKGVLDFITIEVELI